MPNRSIASEIDKESIMNQSTVLLNAAFIVVKIIFNLIRERNSTDLQATSKALPYRAPKSLLTQVATTPNPIAQSHLLESRQSITVAGHYAYVQTATHLIIFNIEDKHHPVKVSESLLRS